MSFHSPHQALQSRDSPSKGMQLIAILSLVPSTWSFFRHLCHGEVGIGRIDPIVSQDEVFAHVRGLHGSGNGQLMKSLKGEERALFIDFAKKMIC